MKQTTQTTPAAAPQTEPSLAPLLEQLNRYVQRSAAVRAGLRDQAGDDDEAHLLSMLKFEFARSLKELYLGMHAIAVLDDLADVSEDERGAMLRMVLRRLDLWLEGWTPDTGSGPLTILHHSIEFEAVKELAARLRESIEPTKASAKRK